MGQKNDKSGCLGCGCLTFLFLIFIAGVSQAKNPEVPITLTIIGAVLFVYIIQQQSKKAAQNKKANEQPSDQNLQQKEDNKEQLSTPEFKPVQQEGVILKNVEQSPSTSTSSKGRVYVIKSTPERKKAELTKFQQSKQVQRDTPIRNRQRAERFRTIQFERKENWQEFEKIIRSYNISRLYHFTDRNNIASIKEHGGLYSWYTLEQKNIPIPCPGGDELSRRLDQRYQLQDYVRLCFHPDQPMKYVAQRDNRIGRCMILSIDPEVIYCKDTVFSDENATANSVNIGTTAEDFKKIRFDIFSEGRWSSPEEKRYFQAEVLVKKHIPMEYILAINPDY